MTKEFEAAKKAYLRGDKRKLSAFVRANTLTPEQSEFVAQALSGELHIKDGRSEKSWTSTLLYEYSEIKLSGSLKKILFGDISNPSGETIYGVLADRHGYRNSDTVKKAITRAVKRRDELIKARSEEYSFDGSGADAYLDHLYEMKSQGRDFKVMIPAAEFKKWMDQNPDLVPPEGFEATDFAIDVDSQIEMLEAIQSGTQSKINVPDSEDSDR